MATPGHKPGERTASGASETFEALYREHSPSAYRLAFLLTGDPDLAEDLVQDAFIRVIGRLGQLRSRDGFDAYLKRTVTNLSYSVFRRRRVERAFLAREGAMAAVRVSEPAAIEDSDLLWSQLRRLAPRQRAVLVLRYYEDLSEHQTAELLGCSLWTVKSLVSRGLASMRAQQGGQG